MFSFYLHERRVELEIAVVGADVIARRHDSLHDQGKSHGIKDSILGR